MIEFLSVAWPFWFIAFIILAFAINSKIKYNRIHTASKQGVIIECNRNSKYNDHGYLISETYDIVLEYMGLQYNIEKSVFAYDVGDVVDFVFQGKSVKILTETNNCFHSASIVHPKGYKILFAVFWFFFIFPILSLLSQIQSIGDILIIVLPTAGIIALQRVINTKNKAIKTKSLLKVNAKVVDVRKEVSHSSDHRRVTYYYNVSYEYNGKQYYVSIPEVCNNQNNGVETYRTINIDAYTGKYVNLNPGPVVALCRFVQIFLVILLIFSSISVFFS